MKKAILLVNLGTPDSYETSDVARYLKEFLTDPRVIPLPFLKRQALVRLLIVPKRAKSSAELYQKLWTKEGSPLLFHTKSLAEKLQENLEEEVFFAMRYQNPSLKTVLREIEKKAIEALTVVPLFPQYASATTGSVLEVVMKEIQKWEVIPHLRIISEFAEHPAFIRSLAVQARKKDLSDYDHILFSYHGLPEAQVRSQDRFSFCLQTENCCARRKKENFYCYAAQAHATTRALVKELDIPEGRYTICYQSRLGKQKWLSPYASDVLKDLANKGAKRLLVFAPSFVCDCLETTIEIGLEYKELFQELGGERLDLVEGLNADPSWIEALAEIVQEPSEKPCIQV